MGVMETKIIQVDNDPRMINAANEAWARWGWSVLNIQVTHSQNTREYQDWAQYGSNEVTVETTTINYATITYQRDKGMPCYDSISELEREYDLVDDRVGAQFESRRKALNNEKLELPQPIEAGAGTIIAMLFSVYFFFAPLILKSIPEYKNAPLMSVITIMGGAALAFIFFLSRYMKSRSPENKALRTQRDQRITAINAELTEMNNTEYSMINAEKERIVNEAAQLMRAV